MAIRLGREGGGRSDRGVVVENPEKEEEESGVDCFFLQLNSPLVKKLRAGSVRRPAGWTAGRPTV